MMFKILLDRLLKILLRCSANTLAVARQDLFLLVLE